MVDVATALQTLTDHVDAAAVSETGKLGLLEAAIAALQANPNDPATLAQIQVIQDKIDAIKQAADDAAVPPLPAPAP